MARFARMRQRRGGALRHKIILQTPTKTANTFGDQVPTWADATNGHTRANVVALSSRQSGDDEAETGDDEFMIEMRYRNDVTKQSRILWGARTLEVTGIDFSDQHRGWMDVYARERDIT